MHKGMIACLEEIMDQIRKKMLALKNIYTLKDEIKKNITSQHLITK